MTSQDHYQTFSQLVRHEGEGVDYSRFWVDRHSRLAVVAPHGGGIEPGTSEIALALAGDTFTVYCFEALKDNGGEALHITSHRFDDPQCIDLLSRAELAVSIHGCAEQHQVVMVGGKHAALKSRVVDGLIQAGFTAHEDSSHHSGLHQDNICNRTSSGAGVQIELSDGLRQTMFRGLTRRERQYKTPVFHLFIDTLKPIFEQMEAENA